MIYEVKKAGLSEEERRVLFACDWMVDHNETIRETAKAWGYPSTTFWRKIHFVCPELSPDLYDDVKKQIKINIRKRRKRK